MSEQDTDDPMVAFAEGVAPAIVQVFRLHSKYIFRICWAYLRNNEDASEEVQKAFVELLEHVRAHGWPGDADVREWLIKTAKTSCSTRVRKASRRASLLRKYPDAASPTPPRTDIELSVLRSRVIDACLRLQPEHRDVLLQRWFYEDTFDDLGKALGIPTGTAKSRYAKAIAALKAELGGRL